jgi:hypothetical protein
VADWTPIVKAPTIGFDLWHVNLTQHAQDRGFTGHAPQIREESLERDLMQVRPMSNGARRLGTAGLASGIDEQ